MTRKHIDAFLRPGDAETRSKSSGQNRSQVTREVSKGDADKPGTGICRFALENGDVRRAERSPIAAGGSIAVNSGRKFKRSIIVMLG